MPIRDNRLIDGTTFTAHFGSTRCMGFASKCHWNLLGDRGTQRHVEDLLKLWVTETAQCFLLHTGRPLGCHLDFPFIFDVIREGLLTDVELPCNFSLGPATFILSDDRGFLLHLHCTVFAEFCWGFH